MPKKYYRGKNFRAEALGIIRDANRILTEYQRQGYKMTLRQLYYQFVQEGLLPNKQENYKRLGDIINDARLAGMIDWEAIEDLGRYLRENSHWDSPQDVIDACANQFRYDKWADQANRVEVFVEKDALVGIVAQAAKEEDCPAFSCRGYASATSMWEASQRILKRMKKGQRTVILHLGDFDPSGVDMTRDIRDRFLEFLVYDWNREVMKPEGKEGKTFADVIKHMTDKGVMFSVERIALNMPQIEEYNPPPNPAKEVDPRFKKFQAEHGDESWELDALRPDVLAELIRTSIEAHRDEDLWLEATEREQEARGGIAKVAGKWEQVVRHAEFLDRDEEE
jgi:hypothetical protein